MNYKAIFSDVDGTLVPVGPHTKPTKKVIGAVQKAKQASVLFCLVSGRPFNWLTDVIAELGITDPCIINGGTQIIDPTSEKILWEQSLSHEDVNKILEIAEKNHFAFLVNDSGIEYKNEKREYVNPIAAQIMYLEEQQVSEVLQELSKISTLASHKIFSWEKGKNDIYIVHNQATKEHAANELAKILGITMDEVIGIGDSGNDVPLLKACGLKVALESGTDELKAIANYIAPSLENDGVADVIEKFILN